MNQARRGWQSALGLVAAAVLIVLAVPLAILAALTMYLRALVMALASLLPGRKAAASERALHGPHFIEPSRVKGGDSAR